MVHAIVPFGIRGAIWYQGESNRGQGVGYEQRMHALINGWRSVWNQGDFPFLYVQLAPYKYVKPPAVDAQNLLPQVWEAQTKVLAMKNTGMAVTTDITNLNDIHPRNKQDVGKRLALWALAKTYGKTGLVYSGPLYKSMKVEDGKMTLVGTNGARLAIYYGERAEGAGVYIIPLRTAQLVATLDIQRMILRQQKVVLLGDGVQVISSLVDGNLPDITKAMPKGTKSFTANAEEMRKAVEVVSAMQDTKVRAVRVIKADESVVFEVPRGDNEGRVMRAA